MLQLIPSHGRDYESLAEVTKSLASGQDFVVADISSQWDGKPCNVDDLRRAGHKDVKVRYAGLRKVSMVSLDMIGRPPRPSTGPSPRGTASQSPSPLASASRPTRRSSRRPSRRAA